MLKVVVSLLIIIFSFQNLFAADIPIIVIAPSKKVQSISTVGSSVSVYDESYIEGTNDFFLGDILGNGTTSFNYFQTGGHGTNSGIQLRGLPKRYSTVYIDGVKMSDPSSPSNDFYFDHILKSQISRVEILKGNQSSVYGSGAIGGTINITTKKGKPGFQKDIKTPPKIELNFQKAYTQFSKNVVPRTFTENIINVCSCFGLLMGAV